MRKKRWKGFIEKIPRCRALKRSSSIRKIFHRWTSKRQWFLPPLCGARKGNRMYNKFRVFGTNTSKRGAPVRRMSSPPYFRREKLPYLAHINFETLGQHPPPAPALEQRVTTGWLGSCVPSPKTTSVGTHLITPYTSRPSDRPDPVRRIYKGRPSSTLCKWKQVNRTEAHKVTGTQKQWVARVGRR